MKKLLLLSMLMLLVVSSTMLSGCAGACQRIKSNGSVIGTTNGDWLVIKQSGGLITDVYKLENVFVQSEAGSDGWLFLDQDGNPVHIGGDMKAMRIEKNKELIFSACVEYHQETDTVPYTYRLKEYLSNSQVKYKEPFNGIN